eukprot:524879-Pelagomonas_calceolata.AAC.8
MALRTTQHHLSIAPAGSPCIFFVLGLQEYLAPFMRYACESALHCTELAAFSAHLTQRESQEQHATVQAFANGLSHLSGNGWLQEIGVWGQGGVWGCATESEPSALISNGCYSGGFLNEMHTGAIMLLVSNWLLALSLRDLMLQCTVLAITKAEGSDAQCGVKRVLKHSSSHFSLSFTVSATLSLRARCVRKLTTLPVSAGCWVVPQCMLVDQDRGEKNRILCLA